MALAWTFALGCCRAPATQVELALGTDAPSGRRVELRVVSLRGALDPSQLGAVATRGIREVSLAREIAAPPTELGSVGVLPIAPGSDEPVTVWIRASLAATPRAPAVSIDRVARVRFVPQRPLVARVFLAFRCADRAVGCTSVAPDQCTVSVRCSEQDATCGDEGECVTPDLATTEADAARTDASHTSFDVTAQRADASNEAAAQDATSDAPDDAVAIAPPRLIAPLSTSTVMTTRPTLRVSLADAMDGTQFQVCRDRALTVACVSGRSASDRWTPDAALAAGWWFWSASATRAAAIGSRQEAVWQFRVPARDRGRDTSFGTSSDFDGDGVGDLIVSSVEIARSAVFRYDFRSSAPTRETVLASTTASQLGHALRPAGDLDGDGFGDLLVGEHFASDRGAERGRAWILFGGARGLDAARSATLDGDAPGDHFGGAVDGAGDIDGDGYGDFIVGASSARSLGLEASGAAYVYFGSADRRFTRRVSLQGRANFERFGAAVAGVGDSDGDGFADIVVTAVGAAWAGSIESGRLALYAGGRAGLVMEPTFEAGGEADEDRLGLRVGAGDVNGDGLGDWVVGLWSATRSGRSVAGAARVYLGDASAPRRWTQIDGAMTGAQLGTSVDVVGDCDGDGFDDVAIGANFASNGVVRSGSVSLYRGGVAPITAGDALTLWGRGDGEQLGWEIGAPGDVDGDGRADVVVGARDALGGAGALLVLRGLRNRLGQLDLARPQWIDGAGAEQLGFCVASSSARRERQSQPRARPNA